MRALRQTPLCAVLLCHTNDPSNAGTQSACVKKKTILNPKSPFVLLHDTEIHKKKLQSMHTSPHMVC